MLGDHLDEMVRDRVWLVVSRVVVVMMPVAMIMIMAFRNGDARIDEVRFGQQMEANVMDLEDEQSRHQRTQPPTC